MVNLMGTNQIIELENLLKRLPQGIMDMMDPEGLAIITNYIAIFNKALTDANAKLMEMRRIEPFLALSEEMDAAKRTLHISTVDLPAFNGKEALDNQRKYWESVKAIQIAAMEKIRGEQANQNPGSLNFPKIPQEVLDSYNQAVEALNKIDFTRFQTGLDISGVLLSATNQFISFGETIKGIFADSKLSFAEFVNLLTSGLSVITSGFEAFKMIKEALTVITIADTLAQGKNAVANIASAVAMGVANQALSATAAGLAVSSAIAAGAWVPFPGNLAAMATGVGAVMTGLATIPAAMGLAAVGLAEGGIIPAGYNNDTFPAMLSSNEAVIPLSKFPNLFQGRGNKKQQVEFIIDGRVLKGILRDAEMMGGIA